MFDHEMSDAQEITTGRENELAMAVVGRHMEEIRKVAMAEIISSSPESVGLRERMIVTCQILDAVKHAMEKAIASGQAANYRVNMAETISLRR